MLYLCSILSVDMCRMASSSIVYPIGTAKYCIMAPSLSQSVFQQNQFTVEQLVDLYGFQEVAENPPGEYSSLKVDINAQLAQIRQTFTNNTGSAYTYFANLSALFMGLKDPHTLFVKPQFFKNFRIYFPLQFTNNGSLFYASNFPEESTYYSIKQAYEAQYGTLDLDPSDMIMKINGKEPLDFFTYFANKYDYSAKSDHGRVNSQLASAFYNKRLDIYNFPDSTDETIMINFLSGKKITVHFVIKSAVTFNSSADAISLYQSEIINVSPYEEQLTFVKKPKKPLMEHLEPIISNTTSSDFQAIMNGSYFTLYKYQNRDVVLAITSFGASDAATTTEETYNLLLKLDDVMTSNNTLYVSVVANGGGWVSLGHLLADGLFHEEYPIYGRYNILKSNLAQLLLQSGSSFEDMHRFDWIDGTTFTNESDYNSTVSMDWYSQSGSNASYTEYYGFDDDQDPTIYKWSQKIYAHKSKLNPSQVIILTDSQCGSTCACFVKHLQQMRNSYAIGFGGAFNSTMTFDVGSFAGGAVMDSDEYTESVIQLQSQKWPGLNSSEISTLTAIWMPHKGFLRFAHHMIYSFDSTEDGGTPLEYRPIAVNTTIAVYPSLVGWQGIPGLSVLVPLAMNAIQNVTMYGAICKTENHIEFRQLGSKCTQFGCQYGYYRSGEPQDGNFICVQRVDPYLQVEESINNNGLSGGAIAGIVIASVVVGAGIIIIILFLVKPQLFKKAKKAKAEDTEQLAIKDHAEE